MDSDEYGGTGLSGYAWYHLGRSEGEAAQNEQRVFDALTGQSPVARRDYDALLQQYDRLVQTNDQLHASLATGTRWLREWKDQFEAFEAHADRQAAKLVEVTAKSNEQTQDMKRTFDWLAEKDMKISNLEQAYFEATGASPPDWVDEIDE